MPPRPLLPNEVVRAVTNSPWTKDFRHMLPVPKDWLKIQRGDVFRKAVREHQRIKFWNIVPGDKVYVRGDPERKLRDVLGINRLTNRIYLKTDEEPRSRSRKTQSGENVHYSQCSLFLGEYPYRTDAGTTEYKNVFALRMNMSQPTWSKENQRWQWERYAAATSPRLPVEETPDAGKRLRIEWPEDKTEVKHPDPTAYETSAETSLEVTYDAPTLGQPASWSAYVNGIFNMGYYAPRRPTDDSDAVRERMRTDKDVPFSNKMKMEMHLIRELSNPTARAKRQKKWQDKKTAELELLHTLTKAELAKRHDVGIGMDGRHKSHREARAVALYRWKVKLQDARKAEIQRRWVKRGGELKLEKKVRRRVRKEAQRRRRLAALVLPKGKNQVVPAGVARKQQRHIPL